MVITQLARVFSYKPRDKRDDKEAIRLPDPNPTYTPEQVMDHYAGQYPELSNAVVVRSKSKSNEAEIVYKFKSTLDTKG